MPNLAAYKGGFTRFTEMEIAEFDDSQVKANILTIGLHHRLTQISIRLPSSVGKS